MRDEALSRVTRLTSWIKKYRKDLLSEDGGVSPGKLALATQKKISYWSDVLRSDGKAFGEKAARDVEDKLSMPPNYLDGTGWPFENVDFSRWERLSERQKGAVEDAINDKLAEIESRGSGAANRVAA